jgi:hypothetical protein
MIIVFYHIYIITKKIIDEGNIKDFKKAVSDVCPDWLLVTSGLITIYALGWLIFFISKEYFVRSVVTNWQRITTNSGFWMAFYSLAFAMLYSCRQLKKRPLVGDD